MLLQEAHKLGVLHGRIVDGMLLQGEDGEGRGVRSSRQSAAMAGSQCVQLGEVVASFLSVP